MDLAGQPMNRSPFPTLPKNEDQNDMDSTNLTPTTQTQEPSPKAKRSQAKATRLAQPKSVRSTTEPGPKGEAELLEQYGCGPVQFSGSGNASYERHLIFDNVMPLQAAGAARTFRGAGPLGARPPVATLGPHRRTLRSEEPQARLLSLDGVPGRALARQ